MSAHSLEIETFQADLLRADRVFNIAQRLTGVWGSPEDTHPIVTPDNTERIVQIGDEFRLRVAEDLSTWTCEEFTEDPIPAIPENRFYTWVPKLRFRLPPDITSVRRPTSFEVEDIVSRRTSTVNQPLQPFGKELLHVGLAFLEGVTVTVKPAPEQNVLVVPGEIRQEAFRPENRSTEMRHNPGAPGVMRIDLNSGADNIYDYSQSINATTEEKLLRLLEKLVKKLPDPDELVPYIDPIDVVVEDVSPDDSLSKHVRGRRTLLLHGNNAINPFDKSLLVYDALSKLSSHSAAESYGLIRMMTELGALCAFTIVDNNS